MHLKRKVLIIFILAEILFSGFLLYRLSINESLETANPSFQSSSEYLDSKDSISEVKGIDTSITPPANGVTTRTVSEQTRILSNSQKFLKNNYEKIGADSTTNLSTYNISTEEVNGINHVLYQQVYKNIPVYGGQIYMHLNPNDSFNSTTGKLVNNINVSDTPTLSYSDAKIKVLKDWSSMFASNSEGTTAKGKLIIFDTSLINPYLPGEKYLSWHFEVDDTFNPYVYFLDADTGNILYKASTLININRQIADCSRGREGNFGTCYVGKDIGSFTLGRAEGDPPVGLNPIFRNYDVDTSYDTILNVENYYRTQFGRDGIDGMGGLTGTGKYGIYTFIDALGIVRCPNAGYNRYRGIILCSGESGLVTIAHEAQHGVTTFSVKPDGLIYLFEPGALNEAFSDIYAVFAQKQITGELNWNHSNMRRHDEPSLLSYQAGAKRAPYPDRFYASGYFCTSSVEQDYGGVHFNLTVFGHATYIMSMGKTFNGCTVSGIGTEKTEQILYSALTKYLVENSNFNSAFIAVNTACTNLIGKYNITASDCIQVENAMIATEMDQPGKCSGVARKTPVCKTVPPTNTPSPTKPFSTATPTPIPGTPTVTPTINIRNPNMYQMVQPFENRNKTVQNLCASKGDGWDCSNKCEVYGSEAAYFCSNCEPPSTTTDTDCNYTITNTATYATACCVYSGQPPTPSPTPSPTPIAGDGIACGPMDVYNKQSQAIPDQFIDINDYLAFRKVYMKTCSDDHISYLPCGGKNRRSDANDHKVDIYDFIVFRQAYLKPVCTDRGVGSLPETGEAKNDTLKYVLILTLEALTAGVVIYEIYNYKKHKRS